MSGKSKSLVPIEQIDGMIHTIRGVRVMLDRDLAKIYGVPTFRFNEAIKRNRHRFPPDFMFQLTREEFDSLKSQIAMSKLKDSSQTAMSSAKHRGTAYRPYAFTEDGALQAANVLRSQRALQMSVFVIRAAADRGGFARGHADFRFITLKTATICWLIKLSLPKTATNPQHYLALTPKLRNITPDGGRDLAVRLFVFFTDKNGR